jgi:hypothetical protein
MKVTIEAKKVEKGTAVSIKFEGQETVLAVIGDLHTVEDFAEIEKMVKDAMRKAAWQSVCDLKERLKNPKLFEIVDAWRRR